MAAVLTNNAVSRLASSLTAGATTLSVTTGEGGKFPSPSAGQWFPLTIVKSSGVLEVARCTARSGDVFTVVRAQESTSAQSFTAGDRVELRATAAVFTEQTASTKDAHDAADAAQADVDALEPVVANQRVPQDSATGAASIPSGTTAQRPASPTERMIRYNSETDDYERYHNGAWLKPSEFDVAITEAPIVTVASASTVNIGAAAANTINISGTTTIGAFDTVPAGAVRRLVFQGALTLTHNAASLILPGGVSITTKAGDSAEFVSLGSGNWRCIWFTSGRPGFASGYVDVTASRTSGATYTNSTGRDKFVSIASSNTAALTLVGMVNGVEVARQTTNTVYPNIAGLFFIVPAGATYSFTVAGGTITKFSEL